MEELGPADGVSAETSPWREAFTSPRLGRVVLWASSVGLLVLTATLASSYWLFIATSVGVAALALLSLVVLTGMAGQISLCQATFMGVGAFVMAFMQREAGMPFFLAWLVGAASAAVVGLVVGLPALRVGGLHLAVVTLAFGYAFDYTVFQWDWLSGGQNYGIDFRRPGGFGAGRSFFYLAWGVFAVAVALLARFRHSKSGHAMVAVGDWPRGAASVGINPTFSQLWAFALAAFVAGLAGGLTGALYGNAGGLTFGLNQSILLMTMAAIGGVNYVLGAVVGAVLYVALPEIVRNLHLQPNFSVLLPSLLVVVTMVTNPRGLVDWILKLKGPGTRRARGRTEAHSAQSSAGGRPS